MPKQAVYSFAASSTPTSFTTRRNFVLGDILFPTTEYASLKTYYTQFQGKDQESVVLKVVPVAATGAGN